MKNHSKVVHLNTFLFVIMRRLSFPSLRGVSVTRQPWEVLVGLPCLWLAMTVGEACNGGV